MQLQIRTTAAIAALFAFGASSSHAQNIYFDGLLNSSLGNATIVEDAAGKLSVSNIGSSGLDGVGIATDNSQGCRVTPEMILGSNGRCEIKCSVEQDGLPGLASVSVMVAGDGTGTATLITPDYSALGSSGYTLRISNNGQLVYEQSGLNGSTKIMQGGPWGVFPVQVYMTTMPFGPWGGAYLTCFPYEGGTIVTPPGGGQVIGDFVEFISDPVQAVGVHEVQFLVAGVADFKFASEELRALDHWVMALEEAHLQTQGNGKLKVRNLGSSGCDGVSIQPNDDSLELEVAIEAMVATNNPGGIVEFESATGNGEVDQVRATEFFGEWMFTPDFTQIGSQTYTLELYNQGQLVFQQGGMMGPAVSTTTFAIFYKKVTRLPDGTVIKEWCIGGSSSLQYTVVGGPTLMADMFIVRSQNVNLLDDSLARVMLTGGNLAGDLSILAITEPSDCVGTNYCVAAPNTVGPGALMCSTGSASVGANDLVLTASGLPANKFGLFFYGPNQVQLPFGDGFLCVGGQLNRLPAQLSSASGDVVHALDVTAPPTPGGLISAGQDWNFQFWYRDTGGGFVGFNLTDGFLIAFVP